MSALRARLGDELGALGLALLGLLAAAAALLFIVQPLEERSRQLDAQLRHLPAHAGSRRATQNPADALQSFYEFFRRDERLEDWLSTLYASALASGLELRAADYKRLDSRYGLVRYQVSLPISGTYPQIRAFVENALTAIPVMSVDQLALRRKNVEDVRIDADVVLTLYLPAR